MTKLALDPMCVLSAWEQMGGSAFSSDDVHLNDPDAFTLDLSSWEARLKPLSAAPTSQPDTNLFSSLFNPTGMCLAFLPSCAAATQPSACFFDAAAADGPQVVPLCPSVSAGTIDNTNNNPSDGAWGAAIMDDVTQGSQLDDDVNMSIHFSDVEPLPSASPATSSEAGIVPEFDFGGSPRKAQGCGHDSTATSGSMPHAPATADAQGQAQAAATGTGMLQLPVLPARLGADSAAAAAVQALPSSFFVPVSVGQPHAACPSAVGGCGGAVVIKQEPESESLEANSDATQEQQQLTQPPQHPPPRQSPPASPPAQQLPSGRAHGAANAGQSQQQQSQQQAGAATHVRTRAECLERYRQKKARRLYTKKIRYQLRKINADKRPRIKGRFVKKEELAEFLAAQRGGAMAREEVEDPYFGDVGLDSDDE